MRLIAVRLGQGRWDCHAEGSPEFSVSGPVPGGALDRLCAMLGLATSAFVAVERTTERVVFAQVRPVESESCPDCGGSGRYVGLVVIEECARCEGSGRM